ncbi:MAG TPA: redoxin domain-containing protein [Planctomycetaceae bacterium]|nr:redoxin domain-containing protein [Planctomycetaceae bacterium]
MIDLRCLLAMMLTWVITTAVFADEPAKSEPAPGHSYHGETFNEGPRQAARLMGGTGKVSLKVTSTVDNVQAFFDQGLGQVHGFWYFEAERSFRQAAALDPDCAMAYWGMALANINNEKRAKSFIAEAHKRKEKASPREAKYIDALHAYYHADAKKSKKERAEKYIRDLEKLLYDFPDDLEARSLLAHALWHGRDAGVPITSFFALNAVMGEVFAKEPMHPTHHYRIHLWDKERSQHALESAARCGQSSPAIAHMWHMPGHIYSDLERFDDAVWQQEAAIRVDHAYMIRDTILPDQIHNFAHNTEWIIRNLDHLGRAQEGIAFATNLIEMPRHPKYNARDKKNGTGGFGRQRLFEILERYELWADLLKFCEPPYLDAPNDRSARWDRDRSVGLALLHLKQSEKARAVMDGLDKERRSLQREVDELRLEVEPENMPASALRAENQPAQAPSAARPMNVGDFTPEKRKEQLKRLDGELQRVTKLLAELRGVEAYASGDYATAQRELKAADATKVDPLFMARVQFLSGDKDGALKKLRDSVNGRKQQVRPRAALVDLLIQADKKDEAKTNFEALRTIAGHADLTSPTLTRLAPIAAEFGWAADWRTPAVAAPDVGDRPTLDSLGPKLWSPPTAPSWIARDATGAERSSQEYAGKPTVYLFFLGSGCLHCTEQLQKFGGKIGEWEKLGVNVVGISTDDVTKLQTAVKNFEPQQLPFPLVSDAPLTAFKTWRCHDDFENRPLHGTFFVDAAGRLRWWDISHEPFMDVDFLLQEAPRLLQFAQ